MSKKMWTILLAVLLLLSACAHEEKKETISENQSVETIVNEKEVKAEEQKVETKTETTNSSWNYPAVDMNKAVSDDPDVIKYLDYFMGPAQHVVFLEMDGEKISDKSMAVYSFLQAYQDKPLEDYSRGVPKEQLDESCMKYFGRVPETYESSMLTVDKENGKVQAAGWDGWSFYHVLREKEELADGTVRLLFDLVDPYMSEYESPITYEEYKHAVYSGQLECVPSTGLQKEMILTEHTDENGEFYVQYHSIRVVE